MTLTASISRPGLNKSKPAARCAPLLFAALPVIESWRVCDASGGAAPAEDGLRGGRVERAHGCPAEDGADAAQDPGGGFGADVRGGDGDLRRDALRVIIRSAEDARALVCLRRRLGLADDRGASDVHLEVARRPARAVAPVEIPDPVADPATQPTLTRGRPAIRPHPAPGPSAARTQTRTACSSSCCRWPRPGTPPCRTSPSSAPPRND